MNTLKALTLVLLSLALVIGVQAQENLAEDDTLVYVTAVAWSHDGSRIAAVGIQPPGTKGYLRIIDAQTGQTLYQLEPEPGGFASAAWSPDDRYLAVGGFDQVIWVIDVEARSHIASIPGHRSTILAVDWNSDSTQLVSGGNWDQQVILWDMKSYQQVRMVEAGDIWSVAFSPDHQRIAVGSIFGLVLFPSTLDTSQENPSWLSELYIGGVAWSHDGKRIAFGTQTFGSVTNPNLKTFAELYIVNAATGAVLNKLLTQDMALHGLAWSLDDSLIATSSINGFVRIWDVQAGSALESYPGLTRFPAQVSFSPFGGQLAFGGTVPAAETRLESAPQITEWGGRHLAGGAVQIVVPAPSLERLASIQALCAAQTGTALAFAAPQAAAELDAYIAQVETTEQLPPACAADLLAVARALQTRQG